MRPKITNTEIGKILKSVRRLAGRSRSQMAQYMEMFPEEIDAYESGTTEIHYIDYIRWVYLLIMVY